MGKPVLMGRKTWEGLPFPLPGRPNLVLTRNQNYFSPEAEIYTSVSDLVGRGYEIAGENNLREVMVIGGATLYARLLGHCDRLYVSEIHGDIRGDAYFPEIDQSQWAIKKEQSFRRSPKDDYEFTFRIYDRQK